jgi:hypothetical protein
MCYNYFWQVLLASLALHSLHNSPVVGSVVLQSMDQPNLSSHLAPRGFQFRLATLFALTTVLCFHFAVAAYDVGTAILLAAFSLGATMIYVARTRFQASYFSAGGCAILGVPLFLGLLFGIGTTIDYLTPPRPVDPPSYVQSPNAVVFLTVIGAFCGLLVGLCVAVGYWGIQGTSLLLRSLIIERRDRYYVAEDQPVPRVRNPTSANEPLTLLRE